MDNENIITTYNSKYIQPFTSYKNDYIYDRFIRQNEIYEQNIIDLILKYYIQNTEIIDIGANIGLVTIPIVNIYPNTTIHSFEPDATNFLILQKNTQQHKNINIYQTAISDQNELCNMTIATFNKGGNYIHSSTNQNNKHTKYTHPTTNNIETKIHNVFIPAINIDSIQHIFKQKISVIKIDVEGYETKTIRGAIQTIQKHRPVIIVEIWNRNLTQIIQIMAEIKYNIQKINITTGSIDQNYLCIPFEMKE